MFLKINPVIKMRGTYIFILVYEEDWYKKLRNA